MVECLKHELVPALAEVGLQVLPYAQLSARQAAQAAAWFDELVFPVLTPLAFDPGRPFPHISNLSLNLAVLVEGRGGGPRFARVKVPATLPRLVPVTAGRSQGKRDRPGPQQTYVWLE